MIERFVKKFLPKEKPSIDWDKPVLEAENQWRAEAYQDIQHMERCGCESCKKHIPSVMKEIETDEMRRNAQTYVDWKGDTLQTQEELPEEFSFTADEVIEAKLRRYGGRK